MEKNKKIHFIGIGGIGMSGLARLYLHEGADVSGSDVSETELTRKLSEEGVALSYTQTAENIRSRQGLDLVVYTEAMAEDHPELMAAREAGIRTINYFEALGEIANQYYLIAVAGTHGKTTTTAMLIDIFEEAGLDPTAIVGSLRTKTGSNYRAGTSKYFIVEACEYKRDFLTLEPDLLVITNLEHEHVDYYENLTSVQAAFRELVLKVREDGVIVCNQKDAQVAPVVEGLDSSTDPKIIDYTAVFDPTLNLPQPGVHNQMNAAAAKAAAANMGIESEIITSALENFRGTKRRFEYKGDYHNAPVYDDYAHHPTEIAAAISGAREKHPNKKLTVIFQPHTYSRTAELFDDFATELKKADRVFLVPIYAAREENKSGVSSEQLATKITNAEHFLTHDAAVLAVQESVGPDDVVVVMGAGDVTHIADQLVV